MKAVLQRVNRASVIADGEFSGKCEKGLLILLGVFEGDTEEDVHLLVKKIANLRIFSDENGKMNLSVLNIGGTALVVSNFTLCADYRHGNRPDYLASAAPVEAKRLYLLFCDELASVIGDVGCGVFGADMQISCECDGPVTIVMDSADLTRGKK